MESPFGITVFNKAYAKRGTIGAPGHCIATIRHNLTSTLEMSLPANHERAADLMLPGARMVVTYNGEHALSGPVEMQSGKGPAVRSSLKFIVEDDFRVLGDILGWPVPGSALSAQSGSEYYTATGTAEAIVKNVVAANVARLGKNIVCAPNLDRGAVIPGGVQFRMHPLADRLFPAVDTAGIGVTVRQDGTNRLLDVYTPRVYDKVLSEAGGHITDWEWTKARPGGTRVVVGGQGEGTARTFIGLTDAAREAEYGEILEVYRDARDADNPTLLNKRGQESLDDNRPLAGLKLTLAETDTFRYGGNGVRVGDIVTVDVGGVLITDVLREVVLSFTPQNGFLVSPSVGEKSSSPETTIRSAIAALAKRLSNQEKR